MADSDGDTREPIESHEGIAAGSDIEGPPVAPALPQRAPIQPIQPSPPVSAGKPGLLERWRTPLIVALAVVFLVFGVLDVSSILFHPAQNSGTTRPLIVNAQVVSDTPAPAHPDLVLAPATLAIACGASGHLTVTNRSQRPLQWTVTTDSDGVTFTTDTPRTGLLAPGQSITLAVMAFSQPGPYLLHFSDDHGESADVTVQVSC